MSLQAINCSICNTYEPCYHVCCMVVFACRHCLMDPEILVDYNECPQCYRSLEAVYHSLINKARFNDGFSQSRPRPFTNNNARTLQGSHSQHQLKNNLNFHESRQDAEEEFEFAQTLHQRQSKLKKFTNDFTSHLRNNSNICHQQSYNHQGANNSYGQNKPITPKMNPGTTPFGQRNNFGNGQFNGTRNDYFDNSGQYNVNSYIPNLGFQHQNENYGNNNCNQSRGYNSGNGNGVFNQNIRRSQPFNQNNNFQQNNFQNNDQYQNQNQMNFAVDSKKGNPFSMWNQQRPNNFQQGNFNQQNQGNFNQNQQSQGSNSFQFNNSSFQNRQSFERSTKSVGKVNQLKRVNNFNGNSGSFKVDNRGNHSSSDKEHSPTFGSEFNNDQNFSGAIVSFGGQNNGGREKMEIEYEESQQAQGVKKTNSHDSLVTLGRREGSTE